MPRLLPPPEAFVTEAYGVLILGIQHRDVRRLRRVSEPMAHGTRAWGASYLLMDYLQAHPVRRGSRVLEVGCGWAPAGIFCAKRFGARVTGADLDAAVFPYAQLLANLNDVRLATLERSFQNLGRRDLLGFDAVIGSDICFWPSLIPALEGMIQRALAAGVGRVVLTDPGRAPFYRLCERLQAKRRYKVTTCEWYALEPRRFEGEVVEIRAG